MSRTFWKIMIFWWGVNAAVYLTINTFNGWGNPWPVIINTALFLAYTMSYYKRKLNGKFE